MKRLRSLFGGAPPANDQRTQAGVEAFARAPLPDPGLPADDPRQLVYEILGACGVSVMLMGPRPIEHMLDEAIRRAPILANSSPHGRGVMRLQKDERMLWAAVERPAGSAVIVFGVPQADSRLFTHEIVFRLQEPKNPPISLEFIFLGKAEKSVATMLSECEVVAVTEFVPFQDTAATDGYPVLPITAHRAARHWNRLAGDLYATTFADLEDAQVFLTLMNGRVVLMTPVGEGQAPAWTAPLLAAGTYRIETIEPTVLLAVEAPPLAHGAGLDSAARRLVADVSAAFESARLAE